MANEYGHLTLWEKLTILPILFRSISAALIHLAVAPVRGDHGATTVTKHAIYAAVRTALSLTTSGQQHWSNENTDQAYQTFAKQKGFEPDSVLLSDGAKGHWLGKRSAKKLFVYFHGGGYTLPASPTHFHYMWELDKILNEGGHDIAVLMLSYTVVPFARYPTQLKQAVELLSYLIETEKRQPSDIMIGGDSAGGNLCLGVLSHILHPHPSIPKLKISAPLAGAVLISPWVSFRTDFESYKTNAKSDMICAEMVEPWSKDFLGPSKTDEYSEPLLASAEWWEGLDAAVKDLLIWGGGGEILIDPIKEIAAKLEKAHKGTTTIITPREAHEEMIFSIMLGEKGEKRAKSGKAIESWVSARL